MQIRKGLNGFALRLLVVFGLLAWVLWPGLAAGYARLFCGLANGIFGSADPSMPIAFRPLDQPSRWKDIVLEIRVEAQGEHIRWTIGGSSRLTGYLPAVEVLALIVATPLPWSRRGRALLWGLITVHLFIILRMGLFILKLASDGQFAWFAGVGEPWRSITNGSYDLLVRAPSASFIVPVFIWALIIVRRQDLESLAGRLTANRTSEQASDHTTRGPGDSAPTNPT